MGKPVVMLARKNSPRWQKLETLRGTSFKRENLQIFSWVHKVNSKTTVSPVCSGLLRKEQHAIQKDNYLLFLHSYRFSGLTTYCHRIVTHINLRPASETFEQGLLHHQDTCIFYWLFMYFVSTPMLFPHYRIFYPAARSHGYMYYMYSYCSNCNPPVSIHNFSVMHNIKWKGAF